MTIRCRQCGYVINGDMILAARLDIATRCRSCNHLMVTIDNAVLRCADCRQVMQDKHVCQVIDEQPPIYMVPGGLDDSLQAN